MTDQSKYKNLIRQIKNSFVINVFDNGSMYVFVLAVNKDEDKNRIRVDFGSSTTRRPGHRADSYHCDRLGGSGRESHSDDSERDRGTGLSRLSDNLWP